MAQLEQLAQPEGTSTSQEVPWPLTQIKVSHPGLALTRDPKQDWEPSSRCLCPEQPLLCPSLSAAVETAPAPPSTPRRGHRSTGTPWLASRAWAALGHAGMVSPGTSSPRTSPPAALPQCQPPVPTATVPSVGVGAQHGPAAPQCPRAALHLSQQRSSCCCSSIPQERHKIPTLAEKKRYSKKRMKRTEAVPTLSLFIVFNLCCKKIQYHITATEVSQYHTSSEPFRQ